MTPFLNKVRSLFDFSATRVVERRAGLIPCGGMVKPFAASKVMLLGDAAGMVSPLTAGGIHNALDVGRAAGVAISSFLLDGGKDPAAIVNSALPSFYFKQLLRRAFDLAPPNGFYERMLDSRILRIAAKNIFFHHRGLLSLRAWMDTFSGQISAAAGAVDSDTISN